VAARRVDLVLRGGTVVTATDAFPAGVAIDGETIVAVGPDAALPPAAREIDVAGKLVFPGAIDCHVHLGPEYDDWRGGPIAAAHAGLTTLIGFALYDDAAGRRSRRRSPACARRWAGRRCSTSASTSS